MMKFKPIRLAMCLVACTAACLTLMSAKVRSTEIAPCCLTTPWQLLAGQTIPVGTVNVCNDLDNLYVTYTLGPAIPCTEENGYESAEFGTLHLWVGDTDPTGPVTTLPKTPKGVPIPGQFPYISGDKGLPPATGLTYTFTIPLSDLGITGATTACAKPLYVVAHAEVVLSGCGKADSYETAFGGDQTGTGPRWWYYGKYDVCCDFGPPPVPVCETAYAKGGWVWTTDKKSNPEKLPTLGLTKNRWGWAINLKKTNTSDSPYEFLIYAGAGLNNVGNGNLVGKLTVDWNGTTATISYDFYAPYTWKEVHVYADDLRPLTIAPGQYGYLAYFDPDGPDNNPASYSLTVPLTDSNGTDGVWIVAHAVVCFE